jgi:nitrate/TMAO reductase-like tetraheme cytochrome c subunit
MFNKTTIPLLSAMLLFTLIGCAINSAPQGETPQASAEPAAKSGAELWSANCSRCHNIRAPQSYDDAQWATVVHHMRLRANLDGAEARLITEFLQASH